VDSITKDKIVIGNPQSEMFSDHGGESAKDESTVKADLLLLICRDDDCQSSSKTSLSRM